MAKYDEEAAILFEDVGKTYKGGIVALDGINISIDQGEFVFITGASGAGKSTLMKLLTAEERATEGSVWLEDINVGTLHKDLIPYYRRKIGMIFQDYRLIASKTVFENVAFAMESVGQPAYEIQKRVPLLLAMVGLGDRMKAYPNELSGGEAQRVGIARAMANTPRLLVADEPTGNLDPQTSESIMTLLNDINQTGTMVIACTHDLNIVEKMNKRVIEMSYGQIIYDSAEETTFHVPEEPWNEDSLEEEYVSYPTMAPPPARVLRQPALELTTDRPLPPPPPRVEARASISISSDRPLPPPPPRMETKPSIAISSARILPPPPPRTEVREEISVISARPLPTPPRTARAVPILPLGSSLQEASGEAAEEIRVKSHEETSVKPHEEAHVKSHEEAREVVNEGVSDVASEEASLYALLNPTLDPSQDASLNPFLDPSRYPALDPTWGQSCVSSKGVISYEV